MIGTAFDYLLRFKLQRTYPYAVVKPWVAEYLAGQAEIAVGLAEESEYEEGISIWTSIPVGLTYSLLVKVCQEIVHTDILTVIIGWRCCP